MSPVPESLYCYKKETRALLFSCEYCKIIENIFYVEQLQATASEAALDVPIKRCSEHISKLTEHPWQSVI